MIWCIKSDGFRPKEIQATECPKCRKRNKCPAYQAHLAENQEVEIMEESTTISVNGSPEVDFNTFLQMVDDRINGKPEVIGARTIATMWELSSRLLVQHVEDMDTAYANAVDEDGAPVGIAVTIKFTVRPGKIGGLDVESAIGFVKEKVKAAFSAHVDEKQKTLF